MEATLGKGLKAVEFDENSLGEFKEQEKKKA